MTADPQPPTQHKAAKSSSGELPPLYPLKREKPPPKHIPIHTPLRQQQEYAPPVQRWMLSTEDEDDCIGIDARDPTPPWMEDLPLAEPVGLFRHSGSQPQNESLRTIIDTETNRPPPIRALLPLWTSEGLEAWRDLARLLAAHTVWRWLYEWMCLFVVIMIVGVPIYAAFVHLVIPPDAPLVEAAAILILPVLLLQPLSKERKYNPSTHALALTAMGIAYFSDLHVVFDWLFRAVLTFTALEGWWAAIHFQSRRVEEEEEEEDLEAVHQGTETDPSRAESFGSQAGVYRMLEED